MHKHLPPKNILFTTDFSEASLAALPYAKDLVRAYKSQLHVLHVTDNAYQYWTGHNIAPLMLPNMPPFQEIVAAAERHLAAWSTAHLSDVAPVPCTKVLVGQPAEAVTEYAQQNNVNLIVLATHGYSGFKHLLLGSVAEKILRLAPCPVLSIRTGPTE